MNYENENNIYNEENNYTTFDQGSLETPEEMKQKVEYVEENLWDKLESTGKKITFTKDIVALYRYLKSPEISWYRKSIIVGALIYFISPIDAIPDLAPFIGYLDDLGVIAALIKYLGNEIRPFYTAENEG